MRLLNQRREIVADNLKIASTVAQRTRGLIGTAEPFPLLIRTRWGIHTFGLKFPMDCVVLGSDYKIGAFRQNMAPNRIFIWNPKLPIIIELPAGTVKNSGLKIGDALLIES